MTYRSPTWIEDEFANVIPSCSMVALTFIITMNLPPARNELQNAFQTIGDIGHLPELHHTLAKRDGRT